MKLMESFPGEPREFQEETINKIEQAFETKGKKFVICEAPTGSGKSFIGATLCLSTNDCCGKFKVKAASPISYYGEQPEPNEKFGGYVLTTTKQLQDQYTELFEDCIPLKGKANYQCELDPICNVTYAPCAYNHGMLGKCMAGGYCEYLNAYSDAIRSKFSVLNYSMMFSMPDVFKNKEILVCDEASELEDALVSHFSMQIDYKKLDYFGIPYSVLRSDDSQAGYLWVCELLQNLKESMPSQKQLKNDKNKMAQNKAKIVKELTEKTKLLANEWNSSEFILELSPNGVSVSPLKINQLARSMFDCADKVLLLSATVINHRKLAESLGIGADEYEYINVESTFDPKKSPIYVAPAKFDMSFKKIDSTMPKMIESVLELCEIHKDDNGIVHTHNMKITKEIQKAVKGDPRFLFREKNTTNEDILWRHFNTKEPTVLVSPSLAFGTSLDNEHGRFQIITKLPYLPIGDKRIKILSKRDFPWYEMKMWIKLIQMCGRCTRSKEDHSKTYIFDKAFMNALKRTHDKLPKAFKERLV